MFMPLAASGNDYVAAAYLVFLFIVLSYLAIMASKLSRIERELVEISDAVDHRDSNAAARAKEPVA